ncbi:hypothetical protein AB9K26_09270 [Psychroserpens sp. XS_ASV72]|uniref:hypothetical protein n=1 Tax=Psychroserpens sp. XS_ASV72 TaxID=3241293 RepID=UPI0035116251
MKTVFSILILCLSLGTSVALKAQNSSVDFIEGSPVYDYDETTISNTATIPGYESKENPIKITGTIYLSDGVTPAKDVVLYIEQPDEYGDFDLRYHNGKRYVHNRGWVKTDADGTYTFYTYIPGNNRRFKELQQLYPIVKAPGTDDYEITSFLFEDDPYLSKSCRKRIAKQNDTDRILKPVKKGDVLIAERDIVLQKDITK